MGWLDGLFCVIVAPALLLALAMLATTLRSIAALPLLRDVAVAHRKAWPSASIVVPACNEAERVAAAVKSMLDQDYPKLQLVVVDDRSTDGTGEIVAELASEDSRLRAVSVTELPPGWLGKLHALQRGVEQSQGEWLLFADADVKLAPAALRKAVTHAERRRLDLLSVLPTIESAGFVGDSVFAFFLALLFVGGRLWQVEDANSKAIAATGAFILVRRAAFERTPGFEWLKLEVADDFGLCLLIKSHGGRCGMINARGEISLTWYANFGEMTRSMQKNFYGILGRFSRTRTTLQAAALAWFALFPAAVLLPIETPGFRLAVVAAELSLFITMLLGSLWTGRPLRGALLPPLGILAVSYMVARSGIVGHRLGGIVWRGVLYPRELLRSNQRVRV